MLGLYRGEKEEEFILSRAAETFQSSQLPGLSELIKVYV